MWLKISPNYTTKTLRNIFCNPHSNAGQILKPDPRLDTKSEPWKRGQPRCPPAAGACVGAEASTAYVWSQVTHAPKGCGAPESEAFIFRAFIFRGRVREIQGARRLFGLERTYAGKGNEEGEGAVLCLVTRLCQHLDQIRFRLSSS